MDYNKVKKESQLDLLPAEFLFHHASGRLMRAIPHMNYMNIPMLMEIKEGIEELQTKIDIMLMQQPEEIREAYGINVVDLEESNLTR